MQLVPKLAPELTFVNATMASLEVVKFAQLLEPALVSRPAVLVLSASYLLKAKRNVPACLASLKRDLSAFQ